MATEAEATTARGTVFAGEAAGVVEKRPVSWYILEVLRYVFLAIVTLILLGPLVLAFLGSFKTNLEVLAWPPTILPSSWRWENYLYILQNIPTPDNPLMPRWIFNSALLAAAHIVLQLIFCSLAAYAFARLRFRGRDFIFAFMLATMMIPGMVLLIPKYLIINMLGWVNTYWAIIVPGAVGAFGIFLLTQFLRSIPRDLEEAAMIDGAGLFTIYSRVVLPLAKPALATLAIIEFQGAWNDFLNALVMLNTVDMFTIPVGLSFLKGSQRIEFFNYILAGSMFNTIPVLIVFALFSRYFIQGVTYSGVKG
jgi:ABC-type glycerol-3-phosphate transport system permease component